MLSKIIVVIAGYHALVGLAYLLFGAWPASILLTPHRLFRDICLARLFTSSKAASRKQKKEEEKKARQLAIERNEMELKTATEELRSFQKENASLMEEHERLRKKWTVADDYLWEVKHQRTTDGGFPGICAG